MSGGRWDMRVRGSVGGGTGVRGHKRAIGVDVG